MWMLLVVCSIIQFIAAFANFYSGNMLAGFMFVIAGILWLITANMWVSEK